MSNNASKDYRVRIWLSASLIIISGIIFLVLCELIYSGNIAGFPKVALNVIASSLLVSGVYSIISQYLLVEKQIEEVTNCFKTVLEEHFSREEIVNLIMDKTHLSENIESSGLARVYPSFNNIKYDLFFEQAKRNIDIFHAYGSTWTRYHLNNIVRQLEMYPDICIRIFLLSPKSSEVQSVSKAAGDNITETQEKMHKVFSDWFSLYEYLLDKKGFIGSFNIYYYTGRPVHSLYRADDEVICVINRVEYNRSEWWPSILCRDVPTNHYCLYRIFLEEMQSIIDKTSTIKVNLEIDDVDQCYNDTLYRLNGNGSELLDFDD